MTRWASLVDLTLADGNEKLPIGFVSYTVVLLIIRHESMIGL